MAIGATSSYNCWSCGEGGRLEDIVPKLSRNYDKSLRPEGMALADAHQFILDEDIELNLDGVEFGAPRLRKREDVEFPLWWLDGFRSWRRSQDAVDYLRRRQVDMRQVNELDFRYDFTRRRVCVPVRNWAGHLMGLHGRAVYKPEECDEDYEYIPYLMYVWRDQGRKISNPQCWLGEHLVDTDKTVVVAESMFDLMSVMRVYRNVLSPLMSGMNDEKLDRISHIRSFVTMFDGDKAGDLARDRFGEYLGSQGRRIKHVELKEGQDGGNMAIDEVLIALDGLVDLD